MSRLLQPFLRNWLLLCLFLLGFPARADIVYPARLQLTETAPGVFEVLFVLPVINGRILKAQPVFPEFCTVVSDPATEVDAFQKKTRYQLRCGGQPLQGQQIGIEGLLGSPIDIILEVSTLEGRTYRTTLSPGDSYYQVPPPPGLDQFLSLGTLKGARSILWQWGLSLMFLAWLLGPASRFRAMLAAAILGSALGNFLGAQEWLLVPSWAGALAVLLISLLLLLPTALGLKSGLSSRNGLALIALGSLLTGGGLPVETALSGYTAGELAILHVFSLAGIAFGVGLLGLLARQVLSVLALTGKDLALPLSKGLASLCLGLLLWKSSLFWNYPSMLPPIPWALTAFAFSAALWAACLPGDERRRVPAWVLPAFALGGLWGIWGIEIPLAWAFLLAITAVFPLGVLFGASLPDPAQKALLAFGGLVGGNYLFQYADTTLSYPLARSVFFAVWLLITVLAFVVVSGWIRSKSGPGRYASAVSAVLLAAVVLSGASLLLAAYPAAVGFPLTEGRLPIPFLSIGLGLLAWGLWPRKRKIHRQMGVERKAPVASLALLMAAFFFLPASGEVRNPWYRPDQMDPAALQGLVERRLWNTYTAFNIADEDDLFRQLADNLEEGLLDNIYLDSRRRLTMGLKEGSQVTVEDVSLGALGSPEGVPSGEEGWKYPATWTVTARVKHLRHIHYRRNQYTGTIALKPMEKGWKISEIILTSEERQVIASGSL